MFTAKAAFSSFSVNDIEQAKKFYIETLGLKINEQPGMGFGIEIPGNATVFVYPKGDQHQPANFTVLNFVVNDIDKAVDELKSLGITIERYEGMPQDDKGIMRGIAQHRGPDIAWFKDPSGNVLSVLQNG